MPADSRRREWGATTRGAYVILFLWSGSRLTTREVAKLTGLSRRGALRMMTVLELDFPITYHDGFWMWAKSD